MRKIIRTELLLGISAFLILAACQSKKTELVWNQSFFQIGTQSSPRTADLNGDGTLDIVIGTGTAEIAFTEQGVLALDGRTGQLLWQQETAAQMIGSASFYDITGDGVQDVFIGGRNHHLKALDGKTGELIWKYQFEKGPILQHARFNFYNSVWVPDQNEDGCPELLTVNGGNWIAEPHASEDRFPGVLMLINAKNGYVLAADTMPDGQESYMSPLCFTQSGSEEPIIIFGSGGETLSGNLYLAPLSFLKEQKLSQAKVIASEQGHGFIAPPVLADLTRDGLLDIVAISHANKILAIDGANQQVIWQHTFPGWESSTAPAVGYFNEDEIPDILMMSCKGVWPDYTDAVQVLFDGETGEIVWQDSIGCFALASPIAYDLDRDGYDEAILSTQAYECEFEFTEETLSPDTIANQLVSVDFQNKTHNVIDHSSDFRNIFSTPWLGDLDQDGYLDIVYCQNLNALDIRRFMGMRVKRISSAIPMQKTPLWGGYMGSRGDGVFWEETD